MLSDNSNLVDHHGNTKADEAAMIAHGDGHQGMFGHEGKRKHHGDHHPEGEHHYKDTYKDNYKDNYKDTYSDNYKDHYSDNYDDNYQDTYKDTYKHPEKSAHHHGESSYQHLKHHRPKEDGSWFKQHEHKEDFKNSRFKDGEHEDDGIHAKGYIGKHKEEQDADSRDTLNTGNYLHQGDNSHHEPILESHNHDTENGNSVSGEGLTGDVGKGRVLVTFSLPHILICRLNNDRHVSEWATNSTDAFLSTPFSLIPNQSMPAFL